MKLTVEQLYEAAVKIYAHKDITVDNAVRRAFELADRVAERVLERDAEDR